MLVLMDASSLEAGFSSMGDPVEDGLLGDVEEEDAALEGAIVIALTCRLGREMLFTAASSASVVDADEVVSPNMLAALRGGSFLRLLLPLLDEEEEASRYPSC